MGVKDRGKEQIYEQTLHDPLSKLMSAPWKTGRNGEGTKQGCGGGRLAIASVLYVPHTG